MNAKEMKILCHIEDAITELDCAFKLLHCRQRMGIGALIWQLMQIVRKFKEGKK